ncbi:hypothetical protein IDSA_06740 [Pseudidiomarina salinarum]|uniref:HD domain-containing protein n=1 Tax=Pseudidiomarina salinarum TaxID=435908 RepID=A0A094L7P9_9GAMM|nr:hypothetical protein [Pseudidiomarina salinarum]KFZ30783.1 hypothetical protein IDSA_06740 [Pseudidiomarina salinarum]RUO71250.1 hypothetical protein CWI79_07430 [Pseudidiomarina salinarum]
MNTTTHETVQPLLVDAAIYRRFIGRYYLSAIKSVSSERDNEVFELTLSDSSGDLTVLARYDQLLDQVILEHTMIHVEVAALPTNAGTVRVCKNLSCAAASKRLGNSLSALPLAQCPQPDVFKAFLVLYARIQSPLMRSFVDDVLLQPKIGISFLQCPATLRSHHAYLGGLLEHAVEVAWNVSGVHALTDIERDVAVVAALLHAVGKTRTLTAGATKTALGTLVEPELLTLEVCADALHNLEYHSLSLANQLRHIWTSGIFREHTCGQNHALLHDVLARSVKSSMISQQSMAFLAEAEIDTPTFA